ncbi:BIRC5 protein, partial [Pygoscelis papua]
AAGAEAALPKEWRLYLVPTRAATFCNWPFTEGCACTPERVSPAGERGRAGNGRRVALTAPPPHPKEHKKHSAGCAFLSLQKDPTNLTLQEFLKLDKERMKNAIKKEISQKVTEVEDAAKSVRREIENL